MGVRLVIRAEDLLAFERVGDLRHEGFNTPANGGVGNALLRPKDERALKAGPLRDAALLQELEGIVAFGAAAPLTGMSKITAVDPLTIRLELSAPDADFMLGLMSYFNKVVAREAVELKGDLKEGPHIGTGPWIFKELAPNVAIKVVRNPDYFLKDEFGNQLPYVDSLDILRIIDSSLALAAFRTGQVMNGPALNKAEAESLKRSNPQTQFVERVTIGSYHMFGLLADVPPTNDVRVRQAINKIINRQEVLDTVWDGKGQLNTWFYASAKEQLLPEEETKKLLSYDPAGAKQLAQAAGFTGWTPRLMHSAALTNAPEEAELVHAQLKGLNINATITPVDSATITAWYSSHDRELVVGQPPTGVSSPNSLLYGVVKTGGLRNVTRMSDPELDRMIDAQAAELKDAARRALLLQEIQRRILNLAAHMPLVAGKSRSMWAPQVRGFEAETDYEHIWLDQ